jgi:BirA family biotin operon repressor/biotin-[acetyl-CoA-carboxylase] ligase
LSGTTSTAPTLNIPLLEQLRAAAGDFVPMDKLGCDLDRIRADLQALAAFGFAIERHPYRGAAYAGPAERLCPDQIEHELATRCVGRRIAVWSRVVSTNDLAARAGSSASNDGLVVLAEEQTAGRGRRGRSWTAPPRSSILMSVLLFPPPELAPAAPETAFGCAWLTALGAVATVEVVTAWTGREASIKWPNDVRLNGRKIAGILVERAGRATHSVSPPSSTLDDAPRNPSGPDRGVVIGIGLNVNIDHDAMPTELRTRATSLQIERGGITADRSDVARDLIRRLDYWYEAGRSLGCDTLNAAWRDRNEVLGRDVLVATHNESRSGRLVDLDFRLGVTLDLERAGARAHDRPSADHDEATSQFLHIPLAEILAIDAVSRSRENPLIGESPGP